jgi:hypothetical protein
MPFPETSDFSESFFGFETKDVATLGVGLSALCRVWVRMPDVARSTSCVWAAAATVLVVFSDSEHVIGPPRSSGSHSYSETSVGVDMGTAALAVHLSVLCRMSSRDFTSPGSDFYVDVAASGYNKNRTRLNDLQPFRPYIGCCCYLQYCTCLNIIHPDLLLSVSMIGHTNSVYTIQSHSVNNHPPTIPSLAYTSPKWRPFPFRCSGQQFLSIFLLFRALNTPHTSWSDHSQVFT